MSVVTADTMMSMAEDVPRVVTTIILLMNAEATVILRHSFFETPYKKKEGYCIEIDNDSYTILFFSF